MSAANAGAGTLLRRQRAAAEHLRRSVLGVDGSLRHPYFRRFRRQLREPTSRATRSELDAVCASSDVVWVGDFHAVPACQTFAADLLGRLAPDGRWHLGVEFVYTRQQALLDRRQRRGLRDEAFRRRIHYEEEWGYPWEGFRALLDRARELEVPVHALDAPPRRGFPGLARRDDHAARRVAEHLISDPSSRMLVLFGESHVCRSHLPRRVAARMRREGREVSSVTVFQNPDSPYWALLDAGGPVPETVRIGADAFAVFHTTPLEKYEAYRQVLDRWREDVPSDEDVDLTPAVHHLISVLARWIGVRPERRRIRHRAGWVEELRDAFPEVYSGPEAFELLDPILLEHGRTSEERIESLALLRERGALYESRSNTLFLERYLPARAGAEGARFLRAALSGRLFEPPEDPSSDVVHKTYAGAFNEGLADLGARLVDPASGWIDGDEPLGDGPEGGPDRQARIRWNALHRTFERAGGWHPPDGIVEALRHGRVHRRLFARDLGVRLGRALFERVRTGRLGAPGLRGLFTRALDPAPRAMRVVLELLRAG